MNKIEPEFSKSIISGVNYLALEAQNNGALEIARILKICVRDICISLENDLPGETTVHSLLNSDFFCAIQFLSKYASLKDEDLKKDILKRIHEVGEILA